MEIHAKKKNTEKMGRMERMIHPGAGSGSGTKWESSTGGESLQTITNEIFCITNVEEGESQGNFTLHPSPVSVSRLRHGFCEMNRLKVLVNNNYYQQ